MKPDNPYAWTPRKAKTKGSRFKKRYLVAAVALGLVAYAVFDPRGLAWWLSQVKP